MTNKEALKAWEKLYAEIDKENWLFVGTINPEMVSLAIKALDSQWIPVTTRPMTEEEEKDACERLGVDHLEDDEKRMFSCPLPDDGQEILTSFFGRYVKEDICSWDEYGCGLENNGDWDGVDAWMPKPEPYKKGGAE